MRIDTLTIVGVGLLGGSIGLAAQARGLTRRVVGVGRDRTRLDAAVTAGIITHIADSLPAGVRDADLVVFCTPVDCIPSQVLEAAHHCQVGAILTDVGSTKADIVNAVENRLPSGVAFVGSHPLAGSEKTGAENAQADLFASRMTVVTATPTTNSAAVDRVEQFWQALGSRVMRMSPTDHDWAVAFTSHVPHAVAAALAGCLLGELFPLAATGFRDATRIAAGDPELWEAIFKANRPAVLAALDKFTDRLGEFRGLLEKNDGPGMVRWLIQGKQVRDALGS